MQTVRYAVWFHGNDQESEGICYSGKNPYIVDEKHLAEEHKTLLHDGIETNKFSICMIIIDEP